MLPAMTRLARYSVANVLSECPVAHGFVQAWIAAAVCMLFLGGIGAIIRHWRHIATPEARSLLAMCAVASLLGPLLLGVMFANSPIELRYLAFATPFFALLLAAAMPRWLRYATLAVQAIALVGLMTRPETMQPARAAAQAATPFLGDGVVLLPRGNDGVGIVGAFANRSPRFKPHPDHRSRCIAAADPCPGRPILPCGAGHARARCLEPCDTPGHACGSCRSVLATGCRR